MKPTIQTYSGFELNIANPDPSTVCVQDIAHALSCIPRFAGHTLEFYSVAQHSVHVSRLVPADFAMSALLHDAAEAYLMDIPSPIKQLIPGYADLEKGLMSAIATVYDCTKWRHPLVKMADRIALATEKRDVMRTVTWWEVDCDPDSVKIVPIPPKEAEMLFLDRWFEITGFYS